MGIFRGIKFQGKSLAAKLSHAVVEGVTFPFGGSGRIYVVLVHSALIAKQVGPGKLATTALTSVPVVAIARAGFCFVKSLPHKVDADQQAMDSLWGFDPPGELGESGAWKVVRELAINLSRGGDAIPCDNLETLPFHELAVRLCFLFDDGEHHPAVDKDIKGDKVDDKLKDLLAKQLHYANLVYEGQQDPGILDMLKDDGFGLNFFNPEAEWEAGEKGSHKPAFYVATNNDTKQILIGIRGTSQMEDVMADILAVPEEYDGTGKQVHSSVGKAAQWMLSRVLPLAQAVDKAGYTIIATGHSLGGAVAALLCLSLKRRGLQVQGYGFGTLPCVAEELAEECRDIFTDMAYRDDVVSRIGPQSLAKLHEELRNYDWESAAKERGPHNPMLGNVSKLAKAARKLTSWTGKGNSKEENEAKDAGMQETEDEILKQGKPLIPGKVVYCYRAQPELRASKPPALQMAVVDGTCPNLHELHINAFMVFDHMIPSYFVALQRPNPVEERRKQEAEEQERKEKEEAEKEQEEEDSKGGGDDDRGTGNGK